MDAKCHSQNTTGEVGQFVFDDEVGIEILNVTLSEAATLDFTHHGSQRHVALAHANFTQAHVSNARALKLVHLNTLIARGIELGCVDLGVEVTHYFNYN
jgi:hypothetical protein